MGGTDVILYQFLPHFFLNIQKKTFHQSKFYKQNPIYIKITFFNRKNIQKNIYKNYLG